MSTNEKRIREFAYQIWESEGQPHGQEARHWEMAHKLAQAEALAPTKAETAKAAKAAKAPAKSAAAKPVAKEAAAKKPRAPRKPATP